jgi:hypothetical protein
MGYTLEPASRYSDVPPVAADSKTSADEGFGGKSNVQRLAKLGLQQREVMLAKEGGDEARKVRMEKQREERAEQEEVRKKEQARLDKMQAMAMKYGGAAAHGGESSSDGDVSENEWD